MIHPLLTAYLDAVDTYDGDDTSENFEGALQRRAEWMRAGRPRLADDSAFLTAIRGDITGGPHISPDAPAEVWRAWRDVMVVDRG